MAGAILCAGVFASFASEPTPTVTNSAVRDPRVREYVMPTRVVWESPAESGVVLDSKLLLRPFSGQITLGDRSGCLMKNYGKAPGVLLDFGRELHGGIQIAVADLQPTSKESKTTALRVRFGESASEAMSELGGESDATNDHAVRDETVQVPWLGTAEIGNTGFRFVRIDLLESNNFVALKAVRAISIRRELPRLGSFKCSDERLNQIWETGAYTVSLCMQDYLWDGIKSDRLVWIGDMHPETSTIAAVFGGLGIVPASLDLIRNETPLPNWMNGISSYSLWWIIIQRDWYLQTGDLGYVKEQAGYLGALLNHLSRFINPEGSETLPETRFLDWPSSENKQAIHAGLQSLMVLAFQAGGEMAAALGDSSLSQKCSATIALLKKHVPPHGNSKQAAALMGLAELAPATKLNRDVLALDGGKRLSTFYGFYVLQARAKAGDYQGCLDNIRQFWGGMLDVGATTFWEDFNLDWTQNAGRIDELPSAAKKDIHGDYGAYCYKGFRHSLCHGWASGPTAWLSHNVLGIEIVEPGGKWVRIVPHLGDLKWAEGTYPTPGGVIKVRHETGPDGKIKSQIDAPAEIKILRQ